MYRHGCVGVSRDVHRHGCVFGIRRCNCSSKRSKEVGVLPRLARGNGPQAMLHGAVSRPGSGVGGFAAQAPKAPFPESPGRAVELRINDRVAWLDRQLLNAPLSLSGRHNHESGGPGTSPPASQPGTCHRPASKTAASVRPASPLAPAGGPRDARKHDIRMPSSSPPQRSHRVDSGGPAQPIGPAMSRNRQDVPTGPGSVLVVAAHRGTLGLVCWNPWRLSCVSFCVPDVNRL